MSYSSRRQNSAASGSSRPPRIGSFKRQAQPPPPPKNPELIQASYPVYNLKWEKLKAFLEGKFPKYEFEEYHVCFRDGSLGTSLAETMCLAHWLIPSNQVVDDVYYFEIPEPLTAVGCPAFPLKHYCNVLRIEWWLMGHAGGLDRDREFA
jgi:hypothetical protein